MKKKKYLVTYSVMGGGTIEVKAHSRSEAEHLFWGTSDNKISKVLSNITLDYPGTTELLDNKEEPYYLTYIELVKKNNPKMWPRFLTMLYSTKDEIETLLNKEGT